MDALEELERLLKERGAQCEIYPRRGKGTLAGAAWYYPATGGYGGLYIARAIRYGDTFTCRLELTPQQAVDATFGRGECHLINAADDLGSGTQSCMCFNCGYTALDDWWDEFNYCPNCGAKVVDE